MVAVLLLLLMLLHGLSMMFALDVSLARVQTKMNECISIWECWRWTTRILRRRKIGSNVPCI